MRVVRGTSVRFQRARIAVALSAAAAPAVKLARACGRTATRAARATLATLTAPQSIVLFLVAGGFACLAAGVYLLFGTGWALVASAPQLYVLAALIAKGASHG